MPRRRRRASPSPRAKVRNPSALPVLYPSDKFRPAVVLAQRLLVCPIIKPVRRRLAALCVSVSRLSTVEKLQCTDNVARGALAIVSTSSNLLSTAQNRVSISDFVPAKPTIHSFLRRFNL